MRQLMKVTGASQPQVERWQKKGLLPRFPRSYEGGGGSRSVLTQEITERAQLLVGHAKQGTQVLSTISLIASLNEPDVGLLREAVIESMTAMRRRLGMDIAAAATPDETGRQRLGAAERIACREGRMWTLQDFAAGPVRKGSARRLAELLALFHRDTDEEISEGDLEAAIDLMLEILHVSGPVLGTEMPLSRMLNELPWLFLPGQADQLRTETRRMLLGIATFHGRCTLVRSAPNDQLLRACQLIPLARRMQLLALNSARIAHLRHTGELTEQNFAGWHDLGMTYADKERMTAHPMWQEWGQMLASGARSDHTDGHHISVCLEDTDTADRLQEYVDFLVSLMPPRALQRLVFYQFAPDEPRVTI